MTREAVIRRIWQETPRLSGVVLEVDEETAAAHTAPGQYILMHAGEKKFPLAIVSSPGEARAFELLFELKDPELVEGATVRFDGPSGLGFDLSAAPGQDILLFAVGSGISAMRPVIDVLLRSRDRYGAITLFLGARSEEEHAYRDEERVWRDSDVEVHRLVGLSWVQDRFRQTGRRAEGACAYVCGMPEMVDAVRATLEGAGLAADRFYLNF